MKDSRIPRGLDVPRSLDDICKVTARLLHNGRQVVNDLLGLVGNVLSRYMARRRILGSYPRRKGQAPYPQSPANRHRRAEVPPRWLLHASSFHGLPFATIQNKARHP